MANNLQFSTTVSGTGARGHELRGVSLTSLIDKADFVATLFLSITGRLPSEGEKKVLNAILVAGIDHGIYPASGFVPRVVAASGNDVYAAMASTLLALGPRHGGAITSAMSTFAAVANLAKASGGDLEKTCLDFITQQKQQKQRIAGFGHPHYKEEDPRSTQLYALAQSAGLDNTYVNITHMIEYALEKSSGRKLVLNVDGAIAALLLTMHFDPLAGNALFGLARVAGSIAHIIEETTDNQTVRRLNEDSISYQPKK